MKKNGLLRLLSVGSLIPLVILCGCASTIDRSFLDSQHTMIMKGCDTPADPQESRLRSLAAIVIALSERGWVINGLDQSQRAVTAEVWRLSKGEKYYHSVVRFTVDDHGDLTLERTAPVTIDGEHAAVLSRWVSLLGTPFTFYRCRPFSDLQELLVQRGFKSLLQ